MNFDNEKKRKIDLFVAVVVTFIFTLLAFYFICKKYPNIFDNNNIKIKKEVTINENGIADAVEKIYDAVVVVTTYKNNQKIASGTGFVYKSNDKNAYILTNNHVIESGDSITVTFTNQKEEKVKLIGSDPLADIAVLSINKDLIIDVAEIGSCDDARIGDTVFAVGAPLDDAYSWTVTRGIISGKDRLVEVSTSKGSVSDWIMSVLQTDAAINSGNSGGPLANANGEVIGITSMKLISDGVEGMGFAIPIETALSYAESIISGKKIEQPYLGIYMVNVSDAYMSREYYAYLSGLNATSGVLITDVEKKSDAYEAGLKANDIIIKMDNTEISNLAYLRYKLYSHKIGDTVKITVNRDGKEVTVSVKLKSSKTN